MNKIIVFFIALILLIYSYKDKELLSKEVDESKTIESENNSEILVKIMYDDEIKEIDMEEYVVGVVACEMPASFELEALKSLSVAARTFALYKLSNNKNYVMKTDTSDQCYIDKLKMKEKWGKNFEKYYKKILNAVNDTSNQYMTYNDDIIISFYFAISNGYTENCINVFSQDLSYLKSVDSKWDKKYNYKEENVKIDVTEFLKDLSIDDKSIKSINVNKNKTGRIDEIIINDKKFKGTRFRKLLNLRSTDIEIEYDNDFVYIKTKGYGHGVGLSQYGANAMASEGYKYDEILKYYYTGIEIMNK